MDTLLLNSTYEPLSIISWKDAIRLECLGKLEVLEVYNDEGITTPSGPYPRPSVVRLFSRVSFSKKDLKFSKNNILLRDEYKCQYCGESGTRGSLTMDHVHPRSKGGKTNWKNIVAACKPCNSRKGSNTPPEVGMKLLTVPYVPLWTKKFSSPRIQNEVWKNYLW